MQETEKRVRRLAIAANGEEDIYHLDSVYTTLMVVDRQMAEMGMALLAQALGRQEDYAQKQLVEETTALGDLLQKVIGGRTIESKIEFFQRNIERR